MSADVPTTEQVAPVASTNGYLSVEQAIENAPLDLTEEDVEDVFGGKVRIRALTAAHAAVVKKLTVDMGNRGNNIGVNWAAMEIKQFQLGVIVPSFTAEAVRTLHATAGPSFARVIEAIDRISGLNKEALRVAQKDFPEPGE